LLPIRYTAVLLLIAALVLLMLEAKFGGHGALAIAGIVCLTFGTLTLVAAPIPEMGVSPWVAIAVSAAFGVITAFLVRIASGRAGARRCSALTPWWAPGRRRWNRLLRKDTFWWRAKSGAPSPHSQLRRGSFVGHRA